MAARVLRIRHQDEVRQKIQATQLINRLTNYALGKEGVTMEPAQVTAALGVLKKSLPDLQSTELTGNPDKPVNMSLGIVPVAPPPRKK